MYIPEVPNPVAVCGNCRATYPVDASCPNCSTGYSGGGNWSDPEEEARRAAARQARRAEQEQRRLERQQEAQRAYEAHQRALEARRRERERQRAQRRLDAVLEMHPALDAHSASVLAKELGKPLEPGTADYRVRGMARLDLSGLERSGAGRQLGAAVADGKAWQAFEQKHSDTDALFKAIDAMPEVGRTFDKQSRGSPLRLSRTIRPLAVPPIPPALQNDPEMKEQVNRFKEAAAGRAKAEKNLDALRFERLSDPVPQPPSPKEKDLLQKKQAADQAVVEALQGMQKTAAKRGFSLNLLQKVEEGKNASAAPGR